MNKFRLNLWNELTKEGKTDRRGSNMALVDASLTQYWASVDRGDGFDHLAGYIIAVVKACNKWLKTKIHKKEKGTFGSTNELFARRKRAVLDLAGTAMTFFRYYLTQIGAGGPRDQLRQRGQYETNRLKTFGSGVAARGQLTTIHEDYRYERQSWLGSGKTANVSGTFVHQFHKSYNKANYDELKGVSTKNVDKIMSRSAETLTGNDWVKIQEFCVLHGLDGSTGTNTQCKYLRAADRTVALVFVRGDGLLEDAGGNLVSATKMNLLLYVVDKYGNLYADYDGLTIALGGRFMNHTSMLAGNDVLCAGNIKMMNGYLTGLDNDSGHYKPHVDRLRDCVKLLLAEGVDFSQTVIRAKSKVGTQTFEDTWNAGNFTNFRDGHASDAQVLVP